MLCGNIQLVPVAFAGAGAGTAVLSPLLPQPLRPPTAIEAVQKPVLRRNARRFIVIRSPLQIAWWRRAGAPENTQAYGGDVTCR